MSDDKTEKKEKNTINENESTSYELVHLKIPKVIAVSSSAETLTGEFTYYFTPFLISLGLGLSLLRLGSSISFGIKTHGSLY